MTHAETPLGSVEVVPFPNRIVKVGDSDSAIVKKIQKRLNAVGCGPIPVDGVFDKDNTEKAVKLFQARFVDVTGRPLKIDGQIGSLTWGALFGAEAVPSVSDAPSALAKAALEFAASQVGVLEQPLGSNRGPEVDEYVKSVGAPLGGFWCVAFTYYCYKKAAERLGVANPHVRTAGVLEHWSKAGQKAGVVRITKAKALANPTLITPGSLFIIDTGGGHGHTGMVKKVENGRLVTIEGNTNNGGSRNGIGVFQREARKIADINKGYIDYSAV